MAISNKEIADKFTEIADFLEIEGQTNPFRIRAMDNPYFNILCHPTGRLLLERAPYEFDIERVMKAAKERDCFFEINAQPSRMDLSDVHCHMIRAFGLKVAISSDAHNTVQLDNMRYGVGQARRGWLQAKHVINTLPWQKLKTLIHRT